MLWQDFPIGNRRKYLILNTREGMTRPGKIQTLDREPSRHSVGGAPVLAPFCYDGQ